MSAERLCRLRTELLCHVGEVLCLLDSLLSLFGIRLIHRFNCDYTLLEGVNSRLGDALEKISKANLLRESVVPAECHRPSVTVNNVAYLVVVISLFYLGGEKCLCRGGDGTVGVTDNQLLSPLGLSFVVVFVEIQLTGGEIRILQRLVIEIILRVLRHYQLHRRDTFRFPIRRIIRIRWHQARGQKHRAKHHKQR